MRAKFRKMFICMLVVIMSLTSVHIDSLAASKKSYTKSDLRYLTAIIYCESGNQSYKGKVAVANVVLNRVNSSKYPNTIKKVIYQKWQFTPARSGSLAKALKLYDKNSSKLSQSKKAAKAALNGKYVLKKKYLSFTGYTKKLARKHTNHQKIGAHIFF